MATRMKQRRGTAAEWAAQNPVLGDGELGFETDTKIIKVGDGVTQYNSLTVPYVSTGGGTMTGALTLVAPTLPNHGARLTDITDIVNAGLGLRSVSTFGANGTFIKGNYPWLRAVKVRVQAGGGGGGGSGTSISTTTSAGGGGGGGAYSESFILASALPASVPVTVGSGGAGGTAASNGANGSDSSFGAIVVATGGFGGEGRGAETTLKFGVGGRGGTASTGTGDHKMNGGPGGHGVYSGNSAIAVGGQGGTTVLGGGAKAAQGASTASPGETGAPYGGGGSGANTGTSMPAQLGGTGGSGIVIVELYG